MWQRCGGCGEEFRFAHMCQDGVVAETSESRRLELSQYQGQLDLLKRQMLDDGSDASYRTVSWGALRLLLWQLDNRDSK